MHIKQLLGYGVVAGLFFSCGVKPDTAPVAKIQVPAIVAFSQPAPPLFSFQYQSMFGFMDSNGVVHIAPEYEQVRSFSEGLAAVKKEGKWGFLLPSGLFHIAPRYQKASAFSEGKAAIGNGGKEGYINREGMLVIDSVYDKAYAFGDGAAMVEVEGKTGFIDARGHWLVAPIYAMALPFSEGKALLLDTSGLFGYVGLQGEYVIPPVFEKAWPFSGGLAAAKLNGKWGYIDSSGYFKWNIEAQSCWPHNGPLAMAKKDHKWGFLDKEGAWVVPPVYEDVWEYGEGLVAFKEGDRWGFADTTGQVVIAPRYHSHGRFENGLARVLKDSQAIRIDGFGRQIVPQWPGNKQAGMAQLVQAENRLHNDSGYRVTEKPSPLSPPELPEGNLPEIPTAMRPDNSIKNDHPELLIAWERGKVPLARYIAEYMANHWKKEGLLVLLGQASGKQYVIEAGHKANHTLWADLVIVHGKNEIFRHDLTGPDLRHTPANATFLYTRLLNNLWHWDNQGILNHRQFRRFNYALGTPADLFDVKTGQGETACQYTYTQHKWIRK